MIDVNKAKALNSKINEYKQKQADKAAERAYKMKELQNICEKLTSLTGEEVNISNLELVLEKKKEGILKAIQTNTEIITRIQNAENGNINVGLNGAGQMYEDAISQLNQVQQPQVQQMQQPQAMQMYEGVISQLNQLQQPQVQQMQQSQAMYQQNGAQQTTLPPSDYQMGEIPNLNFGANGIVQI